MILEGLLTINGVDPWKEYGAFLTEEQPDDARNYSELLKPAPMKAQREVSLREREGAQLPAALVQRREARDVALQFCILAPDAAAFRKRYADFLALLRTGSDGWLDFHLPELDRHFRMYYKECSDYRQLTGFDGEVAGRFTVCFREPEPAF